MTMVRTAETSPAPSLTAQGAPVWDRLWRHAPSVEKDEVLLARERRGRRWDEIIRQINGTFGSLEGIKTIELGAGRGDLSVLLAERGADVTLLDANARARAQACARFDRLGLRATHVAGNLLEPLSQLEGRFDLVLSSGVVEHFRGDDRTRALAAHHTVLRRGGLAVVSVPHAWCISYRLWKFYLEARRWWPYGMEIPYSKRELRTRLGKAGFGRVQVTAQGFWQSVGDHWLKSILHWPVDLSGTRSIADNLLGMTVIAFAWPARSDKSGGPV